MKKTILFLLLGAMLVFASCAGEIPSKTAETVLPQSFAAVFDESQIAELDNFSQLERAGTWFQGMGFLESGLRERFGDYAGAVLAAYKELSWAYGMGFIKKEDIERSLLGLIAEKNNETVFLIGNAVLAFTRGQWAAASSVLQTFSTNLEEPDSIENWMLLVCDLEKDRNNRRASSAYQAIRGRYSFFPEYWYLGAKLLSGYAAAEYAERCIDFSFNGPYAEECRIILAGYIGIQNEDAVHIRTKNEIDAIISFSADNSDTALLDLLIPLAGFPDNPYTVYAVELMKNLSSIPLFKDYFISQRASSSGRLRERLTAILY